MNRREFIQTGSFMAVSALALPSFINIKKDRNSIGLQLYTLRDVIVNDPQGIMKKVAEAGYSKIEAYSYKDGQIFGMAYKEFSKYTHDLGIKITSGHYSLEQVSDLSNWEKAVADAKSIGQKFMVMPYIEPEDRTAIDDYKKICVNLNQAGEVCNRYGIRFQYHNHDFELLKLNDEIPYDVLLKELDFKNVGMELDLYWVIFAGHDPLTYFEKYPGRFEQWHVKDMEKDNRTINAIVGTGAIDFKRIFAKAKQAGLKNFYIEHDTFTGSSLDCIKPDADYIKSII